MNKRILLLAVLLGACAGGSTTNNHAPTSRSDRNVLTFEDLTKTGPQDLLTAVQTLRPHWLSKRGTSTLNQQEIIKVYLDGNLMGSPEALRQITTHSIRSVRHLDGIEATQRFGLDHGQGAILVFTRPGQH
jgi:hypothetical protein